MMNFRLRPLPRASTVLALVSSSFAGSAWAQAEAEDFSLTPVLTVMVVLAIVIFLVRRFLRKYVQDLMEEPSSEQEHALPGVLKAQEVPAPSTPVFDVVTVAADAVHAVEKRKARERVERRHLGMAMLWEWAIVLGYWLASTLSMLLPWPDSVYQSGPGMTLIFSYPFLFMATLRYFTFRNPSRAYTPGVLGFLAKPFHAWLTIVDPAWRFIWHGLLMTGPLVFGIIDVLDLSGFKSGVGLLAGVALHLWLWRRLQRRLSRKPALKLLVLRVFGLDQTLAFTVNGLLQYWRHFGPYFMVGDPALMKAKTSAVGVYIYLSMLAFFVLLIVQIEVQAFAELSDRGQATVAGIYALGIGGLYLVFARRLAQRQFVRSENDLAARVRKMVERPFTWNLTYRTMLMFCYANTWRAAVARCVNEANAVLMDLRGYSEERQGCAYEVDFLFDVVPVERIIFIVDNNCLDAVQALFTDKWQKLRTVSPNLDNPAPRITLFRTDKANNREMQNLMDLLLLTAGRE
jgi:hypothetical protein